MVYAGYRDYPFVCLPLWRNEHPEDSISYKIRCVIERLE
jgi:hypothetical protein